ncbi:MAG: DUF4236 domain-containing protein [Ruminococcus sp.]|nr:DUF4236 domain-containing protein [Ruminococcus sp.]MCM1380292.1 DUF4236 domain-containing protein [Muribaculaceae bacterium]MCM1478272.1 DUF4236 domain-containing protein [Muribaculaceae bacterium]
MGFRFRKSKKILPGVRVNFSKKGVGVSFGGKRARYSISPTGRRTTSVKVAPGLTYSTSSGGKRKRRSSRTYAPRARSQMSPTTKAVILIAVGAVFLITALKNLSIVWVVISALVIALGVYILVKSNASNGENYGADFIPPDTNAYSKERLLQLQKILVENSPDELIYSKNDLIKMAQYPAANALRISKDSVMIIMKTTDPETFFSRYEVLVKQSEMIGILSDYVNFNGVDPKMVCQEVLNNKQKEIYQMINRYWDKTFTEAEKLKTDNGKKNRYKKFYDTLEQYKNEISDENRQYYTSKYENAVNGL